MDNRKVDPEIKAKYKLDENAVQFGENPPEAKAPTPKPAPVEDFVRKTKEDFGIDESFDDDFEDEVEEQVLEIEKPKKEEKDYLLKAIEQGDEEQKIYLKYVSLGLKQQDGKSLSEEEKEFMLEMNKMYAEQQRQEELLEKQVLEEAEKKQRVLEDYNKQKSVDPSQIDTVKSWEQNINGNTSIPHLLKFVFTMKTAKKKGGKILVKVTRDRNVYIEWINKPISFVEFWTKDEKGTEIPEVTRFNEFKYNFEGTPIPVLFAIQGYAEGFDWFGEFKKDISSEYVARLVSKARHAGFLEGLNQSDKEKKSGLLGTLTEYMPLILIIGLLVLGWLMYTMYGEMAVLYQTMKELQAQLPMVVN